LVGGQPAHRGPEANDRKRFHPKNAKLARSAFERKVPCRVAGKVALRVCQFGSAPYPLTPRQALGDRWILKPLGPEGRKR
jgi:hypothetical protein